MQGRKGFWNYTEPITFEVLNVEIEPVTDPPTHWQNCYVGTVRQVLEVKHGQYVFYIDNEDGSGLRKIARDGGPDSFHRDVRLTKGFEFLYVVPEDWNTYDAEKHLQLEAEQNKWMQQNFPEEFKKLAALRTAAANIQFDHAIKPRPKIAMCNPIGAGNTSCGPEPAGTVKRIVIDESGATFGYGMNDAGSQSKPLSKKKIKKNAQKARRNGK